MKGIVLVVVVAILLWSLWLWLFVSFHLSFYPLHLLVDRTC